MVSQPFGLMVPPRVTVVVPIDPAEPVVTDGAAAAPVAATEAAAVVAPVLVPPPDPPDVPTVEPLEDPVDDEAGQPSA